MKKIAWYKKVISYAYPLTIEKRAGLSIDYYQGQYQLESGGALYSDGYRYAPFRLAYAYLHKQQWLAQTQHFLLLGAGLGSALLTLQKVYQLYPTTHLVEYQAEILALSKKYLLPNQAENVKFISQEASAYLASCSATFDLIGIDLFDALENSFLISQASFWQSIKKVSTKNSKIVVNTIFTEKSKRREFEMLLSKEFLFHRLQRKPNYIYILKVKK